MIHNIVTLNNIFKSFGGVRALKDVSFEINSGEVHALLGENGAGKSTLMKILSGAQAKDGGKIFVDGKEVHFKNTSDSKKLGIGIIYQEFSLVPDLSVAENIFLDKLDKSLWVNWNDIEKKSAVLIKRLGFSIHPLTKVSSLSVAEQQIVEIAKVLSDDVRLIILDEPTAVLGSKEVEKLFEILNELKNQGVGIVYISHHFKEIFAIADRVTILKDGFSIQTNLITEVSKDSLISLMLGRDLGKMFTERLSKIGEYAIEVKHLSYKDKVNDVSFSIQSGEILGMAGLVGSGRTETAEAIFGVHKKNGGEVILFGKLAKINSPSDGIRYRIGMVNEDRKSKGILLSMSIAKNISLTNLKSITNRFGFIDHKKEKIITESLLNKLKIKAVDGDVLAGNLSGGNQQKVAIAKWVNSDSKILIIDEPTRGVDVGAKVEIYKLINELAESGIAVLVISSETDELMGLCDRIVVMRSGKIEGIISKPEYSEEKILRLALNTA